MAEHKYCKRIIEVGLSIKKISEYATEEKNIRQGHISTLHIWWARRPLAACRSIILSSLLPDPVDEKCPAKFKAEAARLFREFRDHVGGKPRNWNDNIELRQVILDFIADFANWDNSFREEYVKLSRDLVSAATNTESKDVKKPLVVDPFSGGGSIPLEALRIGADVFASDLNPVAVLLNKVILEYIPKFGDKLVEEVRKWGDWIEKEAEKELSKYYPLDENNQIPVAYLWARVVKCEGPGCGAVIPLLGNLWLAKKGNKTKALKIIISREKKGVDFKIIDNVKPSEVGAGTVKRGGAICPVCGYVTSAANVKTQFKGRRGGADDARLMAVVTSDPNVSGRFYRLPTEKDLKIVRTANEALLKLTKNSTDKISIIPNETLPYLRSIFNINLLDVNSWGDLFTARQKLALICHVNLVKSIKDKFKPEEAELRDATVSVLALVVSKLTDLSNSLCGWEPNVQCVQHLFGRQAMGIIWDFAEGNLIGDSRGSFLVYLGGMVKILEKYKNRWPPSVPQLASATKHPLPTDSADCIVTDPPYYDLVPYANLSDFFYVWLRRILLDIHPDLFNAELTPKKEEIVQLSERNPIYAYKTRENYEKLMTQSMQECRRVLKPDGVCVVFFAHKGTSAWESQLQSMINAGWIINASWPIETELATRLRGMNSAVLASTINLVCRPREDKDGVLINNYIGEWRAILSELPNRIHEWMPRLAKEGIVGADAIFACLGPALEIFSKYSYVEKANGEKVELREYLEQVWGAVAKEALNMIFQGAHTEGFEEDARLTAMWLWTLFAGVSENGKRADENREIADESDAVGGKTSLSGFSLEFDAARKIAQGLGAHLENLNTLVEIEGEQARLLSVAERVKILFGKDSSTTATYKRKKKDNQMTLFPELEEMKENEWSLGDNKASLGKTILDRLHQAMILFGAGRAEALRRFLVEEGVGKDDRFWRLAQALSALYPTTTDEKRWVDGVLAKKKSLGF